MSSRMLAGTARATPSHVEPEDRDAEDAEERLPDLVALHRRVDEEARELGGEQDRRRFPPGEREHGGTVAPGPVGPGPGTERLSPAAAATPPRAGPRRPGRARTAR